MRIDDDRVSQTVNRDRARHSASSFSKRPGKDLGCLTVLRGGQRGNSRGSSRFRSFSGFLTISVVKNAETLYNALEMTEFKLRRRRHSEEERDFYETHTRPPRPRFSRPAKPDRKWNGLRDLRRIGRDGHGGSATAAAAAKLEFCPQKSRPPRTRPAIPYLFRHPNRTAGTRRQLFRSRAHPLAGTSAD